LRQVAILHRIGRMPQIVADRFVPSGTRWIDLATGERVRVRFAPAGPTSEQMAWNTRCAQLANLRHPLINPLIDYGMADAGRIFEAYAAHGPVRAGGARAESLLTHAARFLEAHQVALTRPLADFVMRPISSRPFDFAQDRPFDFAQDRPFDFAQGRPFDRIQAGPARRRPLGIVLQRRRVFDVLADALDAARPGGACSVSIAGETDSGLRTFRLVAARMARLQGYVPIAPVVLCAHPWIADHLLARHVCVIGEETCGGTAQDLAIASVLTRLSAASSRRHVVLSFGRPLDRADAAYVRMDPMGITAMTGMVFVDPRRGPSPADVFDAARRADGRPGRFLAQLGAYMADPARTATMAVHEIAQPYVVEPVPPPKSRAGERGGRTAGLLRRASDRGEALARTGRHASARRVLTRAVRVLSVSGGHADAARCGILLGWLALDRGRIVDAVQSFEQARDVCPDGGVSVLATIGLGVAWTDEGRLVDAEAALRTSMLAAATLGDRAVMAQAAAALGRCLYWQGRSDEAAGVLRGAGDSCGSPADAARVALTMARVHLSEGAIPPAVRAARHALDLAAGSGNPRAVVSASRVLAAAVAAAGDAGSAMGHIRDGLRAAKEAHLPLAVVRLRLTGADVQIASGAPLEARRAAGRLVAIAARLPRLLRFQARAVRARAEGAGLDAETLAFVQGFGAVALQRALGATTHNPVADLETFLGLGHTASDDRTALERICGELHDRLRTASILIVAAPDRRVLALCGRPWHGDPNVAWRALGSGLSVAADPSVEPCQAAEPLRYGGETIGALAARWTAGTVLDAGRATALLRVGALAAAANVRALLDRALPESAAAAAGEDLLGDSTPARTLREAMARAARAPFPVLIEGESGSGKELVARAVHRLGPRRDRRFCALNCAALSDDLIEAELFGHARGAFTGAVGERPGLFEDADGGTLFLDEIGELSARAQAKLLRVLQDGEVRRVGENVSRRVDVRIVAATNRRLEQEVSAGRFRSDLRFRLDVVRIEVPPLRDRAGDVPLLASRFWSDAAARVGSRATLSPEAIAALARYEWPGNVRELQNVIAWMAVHSPRRGRVGASALPAHFAHATTPSSGTFESAREEFERRFVGAALARANGQRARAAEALGVTRQGLAKMMRRLGLDGT
jgi:DNA-binding NtrC family response regulator/tetratricopeptide (TPR) repeat protein